MAARLVFSVYFGNESGNFFINEMVRSISLIIYHPVPGFANYKIQSIVDIPNKRVQEILLSFIPYFIIIYSV
jgi:hypothetical protein